MTDQPQPRHEDQTPTERLHALLDDYHYEPDDKYATHRCISSKGTTGLTWGNLRAIFDLLPR